jgi:hypothetical protein
VFKLEAGQLKKGSNLLVDKLISIESGGDDVDHDRSITHGICEGWKGSGRLLKGCSTNYDHHRKEQIKLPRVTQITIATKRNR